MIGIIVSALLLAPPPFKKVGERDGVTIESRPVDGSSYVELRLITTTAKTVESLCEAAYGTGKFDPDEPDLKLRKILSETDDERLTYDQIAPPVVSKRDYAVRTKRVRGDDGSCTVSFAAANDSAPEKPEGWVRIEKLKGTWAFAPADGKTKVTYTIHTDPGGTIPPLLRRGDPAGGGRKVDEAHHRPRQDDVATTKRGTS